jgi:hypothetical protein
MFLPIVIVVDVQHFITEKWQGPISGSGVVS